MPGGVLSLRQRLGYGLGDFASNLYWQTVMVYLTFFYTDVFGLSALAAGTMLGVSRSLDALLDPLIGAVADRTRSRWGKYRPYLLWLSVPLAVSGILTFTVPENPSVRLPWAWLTFNLLMLLFTGINIPYAALLATLTPSPAERTTLSSIRFAFAFAAALLVGAAVLPLSRALGAGDAARGWQRCFALLAGVATIAFLVTFRETRERVAPARRPANLRGDLGALLRNGPCVVLIVVSLLSSTYQAVRGSVVVHHLKYYMGAQPLTLPGFLAELGGARVWQLDELMAGFNIGGGIACLCGVLALPAFARAVGRKLGFILLLAAMLACSLSIYWVRPDQIELLFCINLLGSFVGAPSSALLWSMYADALDYAEWRTERRPTGLVFATFSFAGKQGWALGAALSLASLSWFGFTANVAQTPESLRGVRLLVSLVAAAIRALALPFVFFYPLDDARLVQIGQALKERRSAADPDGGAATRAGSPPARAVRPGDGRRQSTSAEGESP